jgi:hypothetical protein
MKYSEEEEKTTRGCQEWTTASFVKGIVLRKTPEANSERGKGQGGEWQPMHRYTRIILQYPERITNLKRG